MWRKSKADLAFDTINIIIMLLSALIFIYPIYFILIASFSDPNLVNTGKVLFVPKGITFIGYKKY